MTVSNDIATGQKNRQENVPLIEARSIDYIQSPSAMALYRANSHFGSVLICK